MGVRHRRLTDDRIDPTGSKLDQSRESVGIGHQLSNDLRLSGPRPARAPLVSQSQNGYSGVAPMEPSDEKHVFSRTSLKASKKITGLPHYDIILDFSTSSSISCSRSPRRVRRCLKSIVFKPLRLFLFLKFTLISLYQSLSAVAPSSPCTRVNMTNANMKPAEPATQPHAHSQSKKRKIIIFSGML